MNKRAKRVSDLIREEIALLLLRKIKDPRLEGVFITEVEISNDLRFAQVYFRMIEGREKQEKALIGLKRASGYIKRELGRNLHLRYMPEIKFMIDPSLEYGQRIEKILCDIRHG